MNNEIIPGEAQPATGTVGLLIGNDVEVEILPSSGSTLGNAVRSSSITVDNSAPVVSNVVVSPDKPSSNSNLNVTYDFFDSDIAGGAITQTDQSSIRWFRKAFAASSFEEQSAFSNLRTVTASSTVSGDEWYSEIVPFDGISIGDIVQSNTVTVQ